MFNEVSAVYVLYQYIVLPSDDFLAYAVLEPSPVCITITNVSVKDVVSLLITAEAHSSMRYAPPVSTPGLPLLGSAGWYTHAEIIIDGAKLKVKLKGEFAVGFVPVPV